MSEYQYYEFRAIDRNLNAKEIEDLNRLSSRAEISPTKFTVTYHYGNFRGKPERLMEEYFDTFIYVSNWGTRQFMVRLPKKVIDQKVLKAFSNENLKSWVKGEFVVIELGIQEEEPDDYWEDGESWMDLLLDIREELLNGDLRALYIGWLSAIVFDEDGVYEDDDPDSLEPPVPPGLKALTAAQEKLALFLNLDEVLLEAAALTSAEMPEAEASQLKLAAWIRSLSVKDKDDWLIQLAGPDSRVARNELLLTFRDAQLESRQHQSATETKRRTLQQLFDAREAHVEVYNRRVAREAAEAATMKAKEAAKKRNAELDLLATRVDQAWKEAEARLKTTRTKRFIECVQDLTDLRDLAKRDGTLEAYRTRLAKFLARHPDKPKLHERVTLAMLSR